MPDSLDQMFKQQSPGTALDQAVLAGKLVVQNGRRYAKVDRQGALWGPLRGGEEMAAGTDICVGIAQNGEPYIIYPGGGAPGPVGPPGPPGDVQEWIYGSGMPDDAGGQDGDMYLENNGRVWNKQMGHWIYTGINITGPPGAPAPSGGATEVWVGPEAPAPRADYVVWYDTDAVPTQVGSVPYVAALPLAPYDGQEVMYQAAGDMEVNGVAWHLKFRAGSASIYKWEFVGGSPLTNGDDALVVTGNVAASPLGSGGPQLTVPLAGDYMVGHGCGQMDNVGNAYAQARTGIFGGATHGNVINVWGAAGAGVAPGFFRDRINGMPAAANLKQLYNTSANGINARFSGRRLELVPVRVK
jgi:hypothetical protein